MARTVQISAVPGNIFGVETWEGEVLQVSPVVVYDGEPIMDGMEIPENARLYARYEFEADVDVLNGVSKNVVLPEPLMAAQEGSIEIAGKNSEGEWTIGELIISSDSGIEARFQMDTFFQSHVDSGGKSGDFGGPGAVEEPEDEYYENVEDPEVPLGSIAFSDEPAESGEEPGEETVEEASVEEALPDEELPIEEIAEDELPGEEISEEEISGEEVSEDEISGEEVLEKEISEKEISGEEVSEDEISGEEVSEEEISEEEVSEEEISGEEVSEEEISGEEVSEEEISEEELPEEELPEGELRPNENPGINESVEYIRDITVSFEIPCVFDPDKIPSSEDDGVREITLESGGRTVTIVLVSEDVLPVRPMVRTVLGEASGYPEFDSVLNIYGFDDDQGTGLYTLGSEGAWIKLKQGDTVSFDQQLELRYLFEVDFSAYKQIKDAIISSGSAQPSEFPTIYEIPELKGLKWPQDIGPITLMASTSHNGLQPFAELNIDDGVALLTFTNQFSGGSLWELDNYHDIENGILQIRCQLDEEEIGDEHTSYDVEIYDEMTITLFIKDNHKSEPYVFKSGKYQDGRFKWEITYKPSGEETGNYYPVYIVDTFDNTKHTLVEETLEAINDSIVTLEGVETQDASTTITWKIASKPDESTPITLMYETRLTDAAILAGGSQTVGNSYQLNDIKGDTIVGPKIVSVTAKPSENQWIEKIGKQSGKYIEWEVAIHTLDRDLINLAMYDSFPEKLALVADSVEVYDRKTGAPIDKDKFTIVNAPVKDSNGTTASFSIKFTNTPYPPDGYIVKYKTEVDSDIFDKLDSSNTFKNKAWLEFDWRIGDGPGYVKHVWPVIEKDVHISASGIRKTGAYDPSTHMITWTVTVNAYAVDVIEGTITDIWPASPEQKYVADSFECDKVYTDFSDKDGKLAFKVGAIGINTCTFSFKTEVVSTEHYAKNNPGVTYGNKVTFEGTVRSKKDTNNTYTVSDTANASVKVHSEVLAKKCINYDYNEAIATWEVTVNQNEMDMGQVTLTDTVSAGQTFVENSVATDNATVPNSVSIVTSATTGSALTITFGNINQKTVITYKTKVDVNKIPEFEMSASVPISNSVKLDMTTPIASESDTAKQIISNSIIDKQGQLHGTEYISYSVNINPNRVNIRAAGTEGIKLTDTIPNNLILDLESVTLWTATVSPDGKFTKVEPAAATFDGSDVFSYSLSSGEKKLSVNLSSSKLSISNTPYILTYDCYIPGGNSGPFDNTITLSGSNISGAPGSSGKSITIKAAGSGITSAKAKLVITKEDSMRPNLKLGGITFNLYRLHGGARILLMTEKTDASGQATFLPLTRGATYVLEEVTTSGEGYVIPGYIIPGYIANTLGVKSGSANGTTMNDAGANNNNEITFTVDDVGTISFTVTNTPKTGGFEFIKQSNEIVDEEDEFGNTFHPVGADDAGFKITAVPNKEPIGNNFTMGEVFTDKFGVVKFENVPFGTYMVEETTTPDYRLPSSFKVTIDKTGVVSDVPEIVKNEYHRPEITIKKIIASGGKPNASIPKDLSGFEFTIYEKNTNGAETAIARAETDTHGQIEEFKDIHDSSGFFKLLHGKEYILKETKFPSGHTGYYYNDLSREYEFGTEEGNNDYNTNWYNYPYAASLEVTKVDSLRPGVKLKDVEFKLYSNESLGNGNLVGTAKTDGNGVATFTGLKLTQDATKPWSGNPNGEPNLLPTTYWLVEKTATIPDGYSDGKGNTSATASPTLNVIAVVLDPNGKTTPRTAIYKHTVENTPTKWQVTSLEFTKYSDKNSQVAGKGDMLLAGAGFRMYDQTPGSALVIGKAGPPGNTDGHGTLSSPPDPVTSDVNGKIIFNNIPFGKYKVKEDTTPAYYHPIVFDVEFDAAGTRIIPTDTEIKLVNRIFRRKLTIEKKDADRGLLPDGIQFRLYKSNDTSFVPITKSVSGGKVEFDNLLGGEEYIVEELNTLNNGKPLRGYYVSGKYNVGKGSATEFENISDIWRNYPYAASIQITKVDGERPEVSIGEATFSLYGSKADALSGNNCLGTKNTSINAEGKSTVTFTGLPLEQNKDASALSTNSEPTLINTSYWIKEISAPEGYVLNSEPFEVVLNGGKGDGVRKQIKEVTVGNQPNTGSLSFKKYSSKDGKLLEGVEFLLYDDTNGSSLVIGAAGEAGNTYYNKSDKKIPAVKSNDSGIVIFEKVPFGIYTIKEIAAPAYHDKLADFKVTVDKNGKVTEFNGKTVVNGAGEIVLTELSVVNKIWRPSVTIKKIDTGGNKIPDVEFTLTRELTKKQVTRKTNKAGEVTFYGLYAGEEYTITEAKQAGYYALKPYTFKVEKKDNYVFVWTNHPIQGSIKIVKTDAKRDRPLEGVKFSLFDPDAFNASPIDTKYTGSDGIVIFDKLELAVAEFPTSSVDATDGTDAHLYDGKMVLSEKKYYVREVDTIGGYVLDTKLIDVTLSPGEQSITKNITNNPSIGNFSFTKVNQWKLPLAGAVFTLTERINNGGYTATATSDANGKVAFDGVPFGTYTVQETTAPTDHYINSQTFEVVVAENGEISKHMPPEVENKFHSGSVRIVKKDKSTNKPMEGVTFTVYDGDTVRGTAVTNDKGIAEFNDLMINKTYVIEEEAPDGYYEPTVATVKVMKRRVYELLWYNYPYNGEISVTKVRADQNNIKLEGVSFGLYSADAPDIKLAEGETDKNGQLTFSGLPLKVTKPATHNKPPEFEASGYIIKELKTIAGYRLVETPIYVTLSPEEQSVTKIVTNDPVTGNFSFTKVNQWNLPLVGAVFTLTEQTNGGYTTTAASDSNGKVAFDNVPFGTYTIQETTAPADHDMNSQTFEVIVAKDGTISKAMPSRVVNKFHSGGVRIVKKDNHTDEPMEGIKFIIYDSEGAIRGTADTNDEGIAEFNDLMINKIYTIKEKTPDGYYEPTVATVELLERKEQKVYELLWQNYPYGSISITKTRTGQSNIKLKGVSFGLYSADAPDVKLAEGETDENGLLTFSGLPLKVTKPATYSEPPELKATEYIIKELKTIAGYRLLEKPVSVILTPDEQHALLDIENTLNPSSSEDTPQDTTIQKFSGAPGMINPGALFGPVVLTEPEVQEEPIDPEEPAEMEEQTARDPRIILGEQEESSEPGEQGEQQEQEESGEPAAGNDRDREDSGENNDGDDNMGIPRTRDEVRPLNEIDPQEILHPVQLPEGYSVVQFSEDVYIIYDGDGVPLGYVELPDGMSLDEIDIMYEMIPFGAPNIKANPKTSNNAKDIGVTCTVLAGMAASATIVSRKRRRLMKLNAK